MQMQAGVIKSQRLLPVVSIIGVKQVTVFFHFSAVLYCKEVFEFNGTNAIVFMQSFFPLRILIEEHKNWVKR